ncbi:hypothetical protein AM571_PA00080 (plasmid) [Rhizobium etli 8C-3]|uniref:Uncharacterized protein n=1 Tax=Rhizobium etli 8C-3 TaxID=538025 RepID=A0A1L5P9X3_RHIET|nr:hypothetical protein AM571_PA00080 [Rhizobium etli 8C-3]
MFNRAGFAVRSRLYLINFHKVLLDLITVENETLRFHHPIKLGVFLVLGLASPNFLNDVFQFNAVFWHHRPSCMMKEYDLCPPVAVSHGLSSIVLIRRQSCFANFTPPARQTMMAV